MEPNFYNEKHILQTLNPTNTTTAASVEAPGLRGWLTSLRLVPSNLILSLFPPVYLTQSNSPRKYSD